MPEKKRREEEDDEEAVDLTVLEVEAGGRAEMGKRLPKPPRPERM